MDGYTCIAKGFEQCIAAARVWSEAESKLVKEYVPVQDSPDPAGEVGELWVKNERIDWSHYRKTKEYRPDTSRPATRSISLNDRQIALPRTSTLSWD